MDIDRLRDKSKVLAKRSRDIRREEKLARDVARYRRAANAHVPMLESLNATLHMKRVVFTRRDARATFLARAYLAGKQRSYMERGVFPIKCVREMALNLIHEVGEDCDMSDFNRWCDT